MVTSSRLLCGDVGATGGEDPGGVGTTPSSWELVS